jgi:hypothetical protein
LPKVPSLEEPKNMWSATAFRNIPDGEVQGLALTSDTATTSQNQIKKFFKKEFCCVGLLL